MRVIDPYRESNEATLRLLAGLSSDQLFARLKRIGIVDKKGKLAAKYRPGSEPKQGESSSPKLAAS